MKGLNVSAAGVAIEACVGNDAEALILDAVAHAKVGSATRIAVKEGGQGKGKGKGRPKKRVKGKSKSKSKGKGKTS